MSRLRAKCPVCRTLTAVSVGPSYECHACGREFAAGLIRVPRAWGEGGDQMAQAAALPLPYPEAAVVTEASLGEQTLTLASDLPERPLVLGGCCCAHVGAIEGLAARYGRIGLVWLDAHGDLNTPETSPSGNPWGMPLRMVIDSGSVDASDVALVGARNLDPSEQAFIAASGLHTGRAQVEFALNGTVGAYVAVDCDALDSADLSSFMPEPGGLTLDEAESLLEGVRERARVLGAGFSGLVPAPTNVEPLRRMAAALGL
jgi:arginase